MQLAEIKPILLANPWFSALPDDMVDKLVSLCKPKHLQKGQQLHAKNGPADGLYCIVNGRMRVSNVNHQGKEMVLTWLEPGSWFGEISLFDGLPRTHDTFADRDTSLLRLPRQDFHQLLQQHPALYPHFMKLLCQRIRATFALIDETGALDLSGQLAKRLLLLASGLHQPTPDTINQPIEISQETLAHMINSSRQTVNKLLQQWQQQGIVELAYGRIHLMDVERLQRMCLV